MGFFFEFHWEGFGGGVVVCQYVNAGRAGNISACGGVLWCVLVGLNARHAVISQRAVDR